MQFGGLPAIYDSKYPEEELDAYVKTYLKEEIRAESLVKKIPAFARFLQVAALTSGQMINFSNIASDTAIPLSTVREYYQILQDPLARKSGRIEIIHWKNFLEDLRGDKIKEIVA